MEEEPVEVRRTARGVLRSGRRRRPDGRWRRDGRGSGACVRCRACIAATTRPRVRRTPRRPRRPCAPRARAPTPSSASACAPTGRSARRSARSWRVELSPHERDVAPATIVRAFSCFVSERYAVGRAGDEQQPGRVLVEPVHDARAGRVADRRDLRVARRAGRARACRSVCPAPGCTTSPGGLVDDEDVVVLEHDRHHDRRVGAPAASTAPRARRLIATAAPSSTRVGTLGRRPRRRR